ncbi:MAG: iron ABC transporter permease [Proteobacteria bacterium]|nr:iron ABC transporter permease [Pseudomonadota bacterium]
MNEFWLNVIQNTLLMILGVCALCSIIALPLSFALERYKIPFGEGIFRALTIPYVFPSYILAISWITLANPTVGWLNKILPFNLNIYSIWGIIFVESSVLMSLLFLNLRSALQKIDPTLEEAARLSGASAWQSFWLVTFPMIKKNFAGGLLSIALASLASFGVPAMLGQAGRIFVMTTSIYSLIKTGSESSFNEALVISSLTLIPTLLLVILVRRWDSSKSKNLASAKASRSEKKEASSLTLITTLSISFLVIFLMVILPVTTLILSSFQKSLSEISINNFSLRAWDYVLTTLPQFWNSFQNSIICALLSTLILVFLAFSLGLLNKHFEKKQNVLGRRIITIIETLLSFFYSIPGTVLALGLTVIVSFLGLDYLQGSLNLIILSYCFKYSNLALKNLSPNFNFIHPSWIEAAEISGAGPWSRIWWIYIPLLKTALLATATLVFMPTLSELSMTLLLSGPMSSTLGVLLFELQEYADRSSAAVVGTLILIFVLVLQRFSRRNYEIAR